MKRVSGTFLASIANFAPSAPPKIVIWRFMLAVSMILGDLLLEILGPESPLDLPLLGEPLLSEPLLASPLLGEPLPGEPRHLSLP